MMSTTALTEEEHMADDDKTPDPPVEDKPAPKAKGKKDAPDPNSPVGDDGVERYGQKVGD